MNTDGQLETDHLSEIDVSDINKVIEKHHSKTTISYREIAETLGCHANESRVHSLGNFLYLTLLYLPSKRPLTSSHKKAAGNTLVQNRVKGHENWIDALLQNGKHSPFIGRVAFLQNDNYVCHPESKKGLRKAIVREKEFKIATQGMYGPARIFYHIFKSKNHEILLRKDKGKKETHVEKLERLCSLGLSLKQTSKNRTIYSIDRFKRFFKSCESLDDFRNAFARYVLRNDFQLQRVILSLYFLEKRGKFFAIIPSTTQKSKKNLIVKSTRITHPLSLYANIGAKTVDSIIQFTDFSGLDYYYSPPTLKRPNARAYLYLACQVSTIDELLVLSQVPNTAKNDFRKATGQINILRKLLIANQDTSKLISSIDKFLEYDKRGCVIDLNLPLNDEFKSCPSNAFVLTMTSPNSDSFIPKFMKQLRSREEKTIYYPYFRFVCCSSYGWHRREFDKMFALSLKILAQDYIFRFYAVGRPGDTSHNISPIAIRSVGQVFDHFKVIPRRSHDHHGTEEC